MPTCLECGIEMGPHMGPLQRCPPCQMAREQIAQPARSALSRALREGLLVRLPCEVCGNPKSEGHHDDYAAPLVVRWLCRLHHRQHHAAEWRSLREESHA